MPDMPLVSIAAINYNNSKYVIDTLESIRQQTYPNIELIIVDDCSTDNSPELIEDWLKTYNGAYKFIKHEVNRGVCAACNSGVKNASGKYYSAIATDDMMLPEKTARQVSVLEESNQEVAVVYSDAYVMDDGGAPLDGLFIQSHRKLTEIPSGYIYEVLLQGNFIPGMAPLFKRSVFDDVGYYDEGLVYEDFDMWLRIAKKYSIIFSDYVSVKYRKRPTGLASTIMNWRYPDIKIFLKHVGAPLPIARLKNIVLEAYYVDDRDTMPLIKELGEKTNNNYFKSAYLLWKFGISPDLGEMVLKHESQSLNDSLLHAGKSDDTSDLSIFTEQVCSALPMDILKSIAWDTYYNHVSNRIELIKALADKTKNKYFRTIYFLCELGIKPVYGEVILSKENEYKDNGVIPEIRKNDYSALLSFVYQIYALLPLDSLKSIAQDVYGRNIPDRMPFFNELAKKTNSRYFRTAYLLCALKIPNVYGEKVLANKKEYIGAGALADITEGEYPDIMVFLEQIRAVVSFEGLKDIALEAYLNNNVEMKQLVDAVVKKTQNRYMKAISTLWKHEVVPGKGKVILSRIDGRESEKSSMLSDMALYKDILSAGRK